MAGDVIPVIKSLAHCLEDLQHAEARGCTLLNAGDEQLSSAIEQVTSAST